jgi:hypothetical protein
MEDPAERKMESGLRTMMSISGIGWREAGAGEHQTDGQCFVVERSRASG